jgi:hypothetical protein
MSRATRSYPQQVCNRRTESPLGKSDFADHLLPTARSLFSNSTSTRLFTWKVWVRIRLLPLVDVVSRRGPRACTVASATLTTAHAFPCAEFDRPVSVVAYRQSQSARLRVRQTSGSRRPAHVRALNSRAWGFQCWSRANLNLLGARHLAGPRGRPPDSRRDGGAT